MQCFIDFQRCNLCEKSGATVGCCAVGCSANFHLLCAREEGSVFQQDKKVYCSMHTDCLTQMVRIEFFLRHLCTCTLGSYASLYVHLSVFHLNKDPTRKKNYLNLASLHTVFCLIRAPGALASSYLLVSGKSRHCELSNGGFGLKIGQFNP